MANDGTGQNWDTTDPTDDELISNMPLQDRDLRLGVELRLEKEHTAFGGSTAGGEHKAGSAMAYVVANAAALPTQRPDGVTNFTTADEGRLALALDTGLLYYLKNVGGTMTWTLVVANASFSQIPESYVRISHETTGNSGSFTSGAWQKRTLNTIVDGGSVADLDVTVSSSNSQFTLNAGNWRFRIRCPAHKVDVHQARLRNVTDGLSFYGTSGWAHLGESDGDSGQDYSEITGRFTIAAAKTFEIQHYCQTTKGANGFGRETRSVTGQDNVYCVAEFWKEV